METVSSSEVGEKAVDVENDIPARRRSVFGN